MARKNGINANNIENARDAKATWEHLGDVAEMLDEVYDEQLFEKKI